MDSHQLKELVVGRLELAADLWRRAAISKGPPTVIEYFWQYVNDLTPAKRMRLYQWITGTRAVSTKKIKRTKIKVVESMDTASLPVAHTCFLRLDLPPYTTLSTLHEKMEIATSEFAFGIA